jgi:hypothetical protein
MVLIFFFFAIYILAPVEKKKIMTPSLGMWFRKIHFEVVTSVMVELWVLRDCLSLVYSMRFSHVFY